MRFGLPRGDLPPLLSFSSCGNHKTAVRAQRAADEHDKSSFPPPSPLTSPAAVHSGCFDLVVRYPASPLWAESRRNIVRSELLFPWCSPPPPPSSFRSSSEKINSLSAALPDVHLLCCQLDSRLALGIAHAVPYILTRPKLWLEWQFIFQPTNQPTAVCSHVGWTHHADARVAHQRAEHSRLPPYPRALCYPDTRHCRSFLSRGLGPVSRQAELRHGLQWDMQPGRTLPNFLRTANELRRQFGRRQLQQRWDIWQRSRALHQRQHVPAFRVAESIVLCNDQLRHHSASLLLR